MRHSLFITFYFLLLNSNLLVAQPWTIQNYTSDDGLPNNVCYQIATDSLGYIIVATDDGLARFNGNTFEVYRTEEGVLSNFPISIDVEPNNKIWVGSWKGGINYLHKDSIYSPLPIKDLINISYIQKEDSLLLISDQRFYFSLYVEKHNEWEKIDKQTNIELSLVSDKRKNLVETRTSNARNVLKTFIKPDKEILLYSILPGLWVYKKGELLRPYMEKIAGRDTVSYFNIDKHGNQWIASKGKIIEISSNGFKTVYDHLPDRKILKVLKKSPTELFFITGFDGLSSHKIYQLNPLTNELLDLSPIIGEKVIPVNMVIDFENNLWISTHNSGVIKLFDNPFHQIPGTSGITINSLCKDKNGRIYAGTQNGLLKLNENDQVTSLKTNLNNDLITYGTIPYKDGILYYGEDDINKSIVLNSYVDGKTVRLSNTPLSNLISMDDNTLFIGIQRLILTNSPPDYTDVFFAAFDDKLILIKQFFKYQNKVGIATNKGVFFIEDDQLIQPNKETWAKLLEGTSITSAIEGNGSLWLGSKKGLIKISDDQITYFEISQGLISNSITTLYMDSQQRLWIGTPKGFSIFKNNQFYSYNKSLGLSSSEIKCFQEDEKGFMWIGTGNGLNKVAINQINSEPSPPNIIIKKVAINQLTVGLNNPISLQSDEIIQIDIDVMSFGYNEGLTYQTRLNDGKWIDLKKLSISFQDLQYGNYQIDFRARKIDSNWSATQTVTFNVLRPFWRSISAFILYGILLLLIIFIAVKLRIRKLQKEKTKLAQIVLLRTQDLEKQKLEISDQAERLKELDLVKSNFYSNISHEFRTPLTLIKGPAEKLKHKATDQLSVKYSDMILQNSERLLKMINELLNLAKIENGKTPFRPSGGNLVLFCEKIINSFELVAEEKGIHLKFQNSDGNYQVLFDHEIIETVMLNLINNAIKFTSMGGEIVVSLWDSSSYIHLSIQDSGIGISDQHLSKIFDKYYTTDLNKSKKGSGIGLYLVSQLIDVHAGTIEVTSAPGKGTKFHISIPKKTVTSESFINQKSVEQKPDDTNKQSTILPSDLQLLIVEDHTDLREFIADNLSPYFKVSEAATGVAGLKIARSAIPDLIISDIMMPEMNGIELLTELRQGEDTSHIPVIMLTAKSSMEVKLQALESGVNDFLTKPFNSMELLLRVKNTLDTISQIKSKFNLAISNPKTTIEPASITTTSVDERFLEKALKVVEDQMNNSDLDVPLFCTEIGMSKTTLHRKLKAITGYSTTEFIRTIRIKRAAQLLEQKYGRVDEISTLVGFSDISFFNRTFKKQFGCNPSQYMEYNK